MPSDGLWGNGTAYISHLDRSFDQWIVNDVPQAIIENIAQASQCSPLCIGGLSMGGYGALSLRARYSQKFKSISAHSSITKLEQMKLFIAENIEIDKDKNSIPNVINIGHIFEEYAGGHEWSYRKKHVENTITFFDQCV